MVTKDNNAGQPPVMGGRQADYGIVTALRDELTAVRTALGAVEEVQEGTDDIRYYQWGRLLCRDGFEVSVVCVCANKMGQQPALNATRDLITAWKPRHVILVGIAGGFPGRFATYGDVGPRASVHRGVCGECGASARRVG
jgi:nucleoside phosphorylase